MKFSLFNSSSTFFICASRGFGLVEMVVGTAVLSVSLLSISSFFQATLRASDMTQSALQADYLLEEGVEVVKIFRNQSYSDSLSKMSTTTDYYFSWTGTGWATSTSDTLIDGRFSRKFVVTDVKRDADGDISSSGTYDPDAKLVTVSVSWAEPMGTKTHSIKAYIMNIFDN